MSLKTAAPTGTLPAAVPVGVSRLLHAPARPARLLGAFPTAAYFAVDDGMIALLTADAVLLPCGLVLPSTSWKTPLDGVRGPALVGDGRVVVDGLDVRAGRLVSRAVPRLPAPTRRALVQAAQALGELDECLPDELAALPDPAAARRLLGRGSGLTPSGDDVLAGYLVASVAYGRPVDGLAREVSAARTTTLSAALLRHAAAGEAIPQLTALLRAMSDGAGVSEAAVALAQVGHTSGRALGAGALAAARGAIG